ncbi:MAG: aminoacyl-tRNA hydrolase [Leptolyngbyaceae cyanobacterium SM2_5_2]|nr:aminoacyl-tRNA hydrolase [Leptolyngbyaceae cyanobacterium SM2_5_2]
MAPSNATSAPEQSPQPVPISLIVGLGNPGPKYVGTRHNIGFEVIDQLSKRWAISLKEERRFQGEYGAGLPLGRHKVYLLKPLTFMNRSGQSIRAVLDWLKLTSATVLIVYDDMDLPVGKLRLRLSGSAGGHNGMKSAIAHLKTQEFSRLRIGIGAGRREDERDQAVVSHVLGNFSKAERQTMDEVVNVAVQALEKSLIDGVEKAMSLYNGIEIVS